MQSRRNKVAHSRTKSALPHFNNVLTSFVIFPSTGVLIKSSPGLNEWGAQKEIAYMEVTQT